MNRIDIHTYLNKIKEKKFFLLNYFLVLFICVLLLFIYVDYSTAKELNDFEGPYEVKRVVDGDTIVIDVNGNEYRVRYIGVDAPESVKPNSPVECYGKEASGYNSRLLENKKVYLERDEVDIDDFGRLLRYVYVKPNFFTTYMVNHRMIEQGYATTLIIPPNVNYSNEFLEASRAAQDQQRGLWSKC